MTPLSTFSAIIVLCVCFVQGQLECKTPTGRDGKCIAVAECPALMEMVRKIDKTDEEINFLKGSVCGYAAINMPKTCCEIVVEQIDSRCFTPDENLGTCMSLRSCPLLNNLLKPPNSEENITFIQNSRCEGSDQDSVCCGPKINNKVPIKHCLPSVAPPDPRTECCGVDSSRTNRITGGNETEIDQFPWLALLEYRGIYDNMIKLLCGGALISSKYVMTASHCVVGSVYQKGTPINVRLGEYDAANDDIDCVEAEGGGEDCNEPLIIIPIEKIIPHKDYDPDSPLRRHDIALLRLANEAPYTEFIRPICLPNKDILQTTAPKMLIASGWGAVSDTKAFSNVKLHVELPYVPLKECQTSYEVQGRKVKLWNGQVCAGGVEGKDSCKGDSGGPLMFYTGKIYHVVGVVSFGTTPCGLKNVPGVYTNVYEYLPWIRSHMKP